MAIEEALYSRLTNFAGLTDLISTRVFQVKKEFGNPAFPYLIFERINSERHSAMTADTGDVTVEWRFHAWAKDASAKAGSKSASDVITQVRAALQRFSGTVAGTEIKASFVVNEFDLGEDEDAVYHKVMDFEITHAE